MMAPDADRDGELRTLVREALKTAPMDPSRAARAHGVVRASWQAANRRRRRARALRWGTLATAAALVLALAWPRSSAPVPAVAPRDVVASVDYLSGTAEGRGEPGAAPAILRVGEVLRSGDALETGAEGFARLRLPDGVQVRLDRRTTVTLVGPRHLALRQGAIYVDTTARTAAGASLAIDAAGAVVRDVGTRYLVSLAGALDVRVREGRVMVERAGQRRDAAAGARVALTPAGDLAVDAAPPYGPAWRWILQAAPPATVDGRTLAEFLAWVVREGGHRVRFADRRLEQSTRDTMVYGAIAGLTVEEALDVVLPSCGLTYRLSEGLITIVTIVADDGAGAR